MNSRLGLILGLLTFVISLAVIYSERIYLSSFVMVHMCILLVNSFSLFFYKNRPYSLFKIFHLFSLFFLGIAPVLQFNNDIRFIGDPRIPYYIKLLASVIILITIVLFNLIYYSVNSKFSIGVFKIVINKLKGFQDVNFYFSKRIEIFMVILSILSFYVIFSINNFNVFNLLLRGGMFTEKVEIQKSLVLLAEKFFRPLSLVIFVVSFSYNRKSRFTNGILFILFLFTAFPLGIARNSVAGFYLPLLLLFVPIFKKKHFFVTALIFGLLVVFPFLDGFRNFSDNSEVSLRVDFEMFKQVHFDAYITFPRVIYHDIVTNGNQLLGVFLFFIPRSIWPSKPLSSGQFHANEIGLIFDNLACSYWAEGYINFGYVGVFIFIMLLAYLSAVVDKMFWTYQNKNSFFNVIYTLLIGMFLFVLRGDLMNSYAYTFGMVFTAVSIYRLLIFMSKLKI